MYIIWTFHTDWIRLNTLLGFRKSALDRIVSWISAGRKSNAGKNVALSWMMGREGYKALLASLKSSETMERRTPKSPVQVDSPLHRLPGYRSQKAELATWGLHTFVALVSITPWPQPTLPNELKLVLS
jgi:hypothetical protein